MPQLGWPITAGVELDLDVFPMLCPGVHSIPVFLALAVSSLTFSADNCGVLISAAQLFPVSLPFLACSTKARCFDHFCATELLVDHKRVASSFVQRKVRDSGCKTIIVWSGQGPLCLFNYYPHSFTLLQASLHFHNVFLFCSHPWWFASHTSIVARRSSGPS